MVKGGFQINKNLKINLLSNPLGNLVVMVHKDHYQNKKQYQFQEEPLQLKKSQKKQTLTKDPLPQNYREENLNLAKEAEETNQDVTLK